MFGYIDLKIGDICNIEKGNQLNKELLSESGKYPVQNGGVKPSGYWGEYNFDENHITISQGGASAGYVNYIYTKFWAGAHCYVITNPLSICNYRYLYFYMKSKEAKLMESQYGAGIPSLSSNDIKDIDIRLPNIEIQESVVSKLENLDRLCNDLSEGLPAEIEARKKQYEYYRNKLLSFDI